MCSRVNFMICMCLQITNIFESMFIFKKTLTFEILLKNIGLHHNIFAALLLLILYPVSVTPLYIASQHNTKAS